MLYLLWCLLICYFAYLQLFLLFLCLDVICFGLLFVLVHGLVVTGWWCLLVLFVICDCLIVLFLFFDFCFLLFGICWFAMIVCGILLFEFVFINLWFLLDNCLHYYCSLCACLALFVGGLSVVLCLWCVWLIWILLSICVFLCEGVDYCWIVVWVFDCGFWFVFCDWFLRLFVVDYLFDLFLCFVV